MGDGRAEGSPATGDRGQLRLSLVPDGDGTPSLKEVRVFEGRKLEDSYVGSLLPQVKVFLPQWRCEGRIWVDMLFLRCCCISLPPSLCHSGHCTVGHHQRLFGGRGWWGKTLQKAGVTPISVASIGFTLFLQQASSGFLSLCCSG